MAEKKDKGGAKDHEQHFHAGAGSSVPVGMKGTAHAGMTASSKREMVQDEYARLKAHGAKGFSDSELRNQARTNVRSRLMGGEGPDVPPVDSPAMRATSQNVRSVKMSLREASWQKSDKLYENPSVTQARGPRKYTPPAEFVSKELPTGHKRWLDQKLSDPKSEFNEGLNVGSSKTHGGKYTPGQRRRLIAYTNALQEGKSHPEALQAVREDRRGKAPSTSGERKRVTGRESELQRYQGRKSKYQSLAPTPREFRFGISASAVDRKPILQEKFPNASEKDIVRIQQYQRQNIADEMLRNQRWTHETKRANILGKTPGKESASDRVVVLTTSVGHPAVSVPSDSLVGQYVIGQRKKFLGKEGVYTRSQMQGKFPETVRDMHIVELSTGVSLGAEGSWGAFQRTGWRAGTKKSRGFGKAIPVGSQVLYDSQGRPVYDSMGNIRFTDGATRRFNVGTDKDLGLRVFVG